MEKLSELKARIADVATDVFEHDWYVLQWLRFEKMNVSKAEAVIRASIKLRQNLRIYDAVDEALSKEIPVVAKLAKDGITPVFIVFIHAEKVRALLKKYGKDNCLRVFSQKYYWAEKDYVDRVNRTYRDFEAKSTLALSTFNIIDLKELSLLGSVHPAVLDIYHSLLKAGFTGTRWTVQNCVAINGSKIVGAAIKTASLFLPMNVQVFDEHDDGWKDVVSNSIQPDIVTAECEAYYRTLKA